MSIASILLSAALLLSACSKTIDDGGSTHVDFRNPKRVLDSVFYAARTGQSQGLASLCDPAGQANEYARRICNATEGGADWESFVKHFASGRVTSEPRISGDKAMVNFVFGESGADSETMEFVRHGERWYLVAF